MDDLISRQAAIYAIEKRMDDITCEEFAEGMSEAITEISLLPSAQPEIVRCRDCKHRIVNEHYGEHGYLNLKAECEWDTGDPYGLGRNAEDDEWFCADGERREDDVDPSNR